MAYRGALVGHLEADHVLFTRSNSTGCIFGIQTSTKAVIPDTVYFLGFLFLAHLLQALGRTKTGICMIHVNQGLSKVLIDFPAFRLTIGTILPTVKRTFIGSETKPFKTLHDYFLCTRHKAFLISIFDAQNKLSTGLACNQKSIEGISGIGKMESSSRRRRQASASRFGIQDEFSKWISIVYFPQTTVRNLSLRSRAAFAAWQRFPPVQCPASGRSGRCLRN